MSLRDEMALYTELTGEDGTKVSIGALGHFLWGYETGIAKGRPKGKWIEQEGYDLDTYWECSECKSDFVLIDGTPKENGYNYCPHCGADMRGDTE